ncbi:MAG TPA: hypothetical protein VGM30_04680 [Puia sp.]|jgi:hypothetical protein
MSLPRGKILFYAVLLTAIAALLVPTARIENAILQHTRGTVIYPRDNAFIGMTVARNLAFYTVWGTTKFSFQSAAASPLYTILLAVFYFIAGEYLVIPLVINLLTAIFFLVILQRWLIRRGLSPVGQLLILLLVIFGTPLPPLVVGGTEHILQLLFSFLFIRSFLAAVPASSPSAQLYASAPSIPSSTRPAPSSSPHPPHGVYIYAFLMVMTGYECSILALAACVFLLWRRQPSLSGQLAMAAFSPIILFGLISLHKGSYFLPNPLLLQSAVYFHSGAWLIGNIIFFLGTAYLLYGRRFLTGRQAVARISFIGVLVLLLIPLCLHSISFFSDTAQQCIDLYEQQYPAAKFVRRYYYRKPIAVNEPGVMSWWSEARKLDFTGMADHAVMKERRTHSWSPAMADSLSRREGVRVAVLSDPSFDLTLFDRWKKVAAWQTGTRNNDSISFYAADSSSIALLRKNLKEYQPSLPAETIVRYY